VFHSSTLSQGKPLVEESCISMMDTCELFTETLIRQLLKKSFNAFCAVNPMLTWLVKDCLDVLVSLITNIVIKSLSLGVFPRSMKAALVKPLIKHSTEIDQGKPAILVLLTLFAAFDTVDHSVLYSRLKDMFGLSGKVLEWFRSYLEQRSQRVSVHGILSDIQFCYLVYHMVQFLVLWFSRYIPVLL